MEYSKKMKELFDLSHPQKRILYTEYIYPGTSFANLSGIVAFKNEKIDPLILDKALNLIIRKHKALRIRLVLSEQSIVRQYVSKYEPIKFYFTDISNPEEIINKEVIKPFPLFESPLFHFSMFRSCYFFKYHHIIVDATSVALLNKEIADTYKYLKEKGDILLIPEDNGFIDFIEEEKNYLTSKQYENDRAYWFYEFEKPPIILNFYKKEQRESIEADRAVFSLGDLLTERILTFCKENNTTLFRFIMSIFYLYFAKSTGSEDITLSTTHHNRIDDTMKNTCGMAVTTIPVRCEIDKDTTFTEFLRYVTDKISTSLQHQRFPFDCLSSYLRDRGVTPGDLLKVVINQIPSLTDEYKVKRFISGYEPSILNIKINPNQLPKGMPLEIGFDYQRNYFSSIEIKLLFNRIKKMIEDAIATPNILISEIDILPEEERKLLLADYSGTTRDYSKERNIIEVISDEARNNPGKTALVFKKNRYSYRELQSLTNYLVSVLIDKGIKRGDVVGVMVERSEYAVIAALSVIKSGCVYLPIDIDYPENRIDYIINDCNVKCLITFKSYKKNNLKYSGEYIFLDEDYPDSKKSADRISLNDSAYIIYTSGTTGNPKGIVIRHGSLLNFCMWYKEFYKPEKNDRVAAYCSFVFDVSINDIFPPLFCGLTLYMIPDEIRYFPDKLNSFFEKNKITLTFLPTKIGEIFIKSVNNHSLRVLSVGGEKLSIFRKKNYKIVNGYGPAENTIYSTFFETEREYCNIPIGKPLSNVKVYVVNEVGMLQPMGIGGELWISGVQLSNGYINDQSLTNERFIENPFDDSEQYKMVYKTGDIVRLLEDGNIEYLGRSDNQVKISGIRIEVEEIEKTILLNNLVKECVVLDCDDLSGNKYLVSFLVVKENFNLDILKRELRERLPRNYMPLKFIPVEKLPFNNNGKIDKSKLREIEKNTIFTKEETCQNSVKLTETEKYLKNVWEKLLRRNDISLYDDFFDIGGDSLRLIEMLSIIKKRFNVDIPVSVVFRENSINRLTQILEKSGQTGLESVIEIRKNENSPVILLIHDISGEITAYSYLIKKLNKDCSILGIRFDSNKDEISINELAKRYIESIKAIIRQSDTYIIGYSSGGTIAYEMARVLSENDSSTKINLILIDTPNYLSSPQILDKLLKNSFRIMVEWVFRSELREVVLLFLKKSREFIWNLFGRVTGKSDGKFYLFPTEEKQRRALMEYIPEKTKAKVFLFKASKNKNITDDKMGWRGLVVNGIEIIPIDGDHLSILDRTNSEKIAGIINEILNSGEKNEEVY